MEAGDYVLRIALPKEYFPFVNESVAIDGANHLDDIVLRRITLATEGPPRPEGVVSGKSPNRRSCRNRRG